MKEILLTKGQVALVDDEDYEWLSQWKWYASWSSHTNSYYARRCSLEDSTKKRIYMHRLILNAKTGQKVDHKNSKTLDNQRSNIRLCTASENQMNKHYHPGSSIYKGVSWDKTNHKWMARLQLNRHGHFLGRFITEIDAAHAYDIAAHKFFGEFAKPNFEEACA